MLSSPGIKRGIELLKKNPGVWPIVVLSCFIAPTMITTIIYHKLKGPEIFTRANPEPWNDFENKNIKFVKPKDFDIKHYQHPRPRFEWKPDLD